MRGRTTALGLQVHLTHVPVLCFIPCVWAGHTITMEWVPKVEGAQKRIGQMPERKILCLGS